MHLFMLHCQVYLDYVKCFQSNLIRFQITCLLTSSSIQLLVCLALSLFPALVLPFSSLFVFVVSRSTPFVSLSFKQKILVLHFGQSSTLADYLWACSLFLYLKTLLPLTFLSLFLAMVCLPPPRIHSSSALLVLLCNLCYCLYF